MQILEIRKTCDVCPSQWEGRLADGRTVYVRFRWGWLRIHLAPIGGTISDAIHADPWFELQLDSEPNGVITLDDVCRLSGLVAPAGHDGGRTERLHLSES
jgi:hypothetical protein